MKDTQKSSKTFEVLSQSLHGKAPEGELVVGGKQRPLKRVNKVSLRSERESAAFRLVFVTWCALVVLGLWC